MDAEVTEGGAVEEEKQRGCCSVAYQPFFSCFGGIDVSGLTERNHMSVNVINKSNQHTHSTGFTPREAL